MRSILVKFHRVGDIPVEKLMGATGVYVFWTPRAQKRPSYVGEGKLLSRLASHTKTHGPSLTGAVAILGYEGKYVKRDARIVEAALLDVASEIDRKPTHNGNNGHRQLLERNFKREGRLRIVISGVDPLLHPTRPKLKSTKIITFRDSGDEYELDHDWNTRPS